MPTNRQISKQQVKVNSVIIFIPANHPFYVVNLKILASNDLQIQNRTLTSNP